MIPPRVRFSQSIFLRYARFKRGMTLGVRGAVIDGEGRVFLVKHSYLPGWYLPGGGVEPGETAEVALGRELMEEGGIRLGGPPELFGLYLNRSGAGRDHVAVYVCRQWSQPDPPNMPNMEIVAAGFYVPAALPEGTTDATRRRIAEITGGLPRTTDW